MRIAHPSFRSVAVAFASVVALSAAALAGECAEGFRCENVCPLARTANTRRSTGTEAVAASVKARAAVVAEVGRNLQRV